MCVSVLCCNRCRLEHCQQSGQGSPFPTLHATPKVRRSDGATLLLGRLYERGSITSESDLLNTTRLDTTLMKLYLLVRHILYLFPDMCLCLSRGTSNSEKEEMNSSRSQIRDVHRALECDCDARTTTWRGLHAVAMQFGKQATFVVRVERVLIIHRRVQGVVSV